MTVILIELVGILAFLSNVWANILIAHKKESGWVVRLGSNALWLAFGIAALSLANILNAVTFAVINVYGLRRWRKERMQPSSCNDHYMQLCTYCREIVRQCNCHIGSNKPTTTDGICGTCRAQLPAALPAKAS